MTYVCSVVVTGRLIELFASFPEYTSYSIAYINKQILPFTDLESFSRDLSDTGIAVKKNI